MVADNDAEDNALLDDKGEDVQSMDALIDLSVHNIIDKNGYVEDKSFIQSMLLFIVVYVIYKY